MSHPIDVVTVDGPSGVGTGTMSQRLAEELGYHYLDSGALYRILGLASIDAGLDLDNAEQVSPLLASSQIEFAVVDGQVLVKLNGQDVSEAIRTEEAGANASKVAVHPAVRAGLLALQQNMAVAPGLVADGRDMGTTVFPDARCKLFLTASNEVRAERRYKQLKDKGVGVSLPRLLNELKARDERDASREASPLQAADDAIVIDTSDLSVEEVFAQVLSQAVPG